MPRPPGAPRVNNIPPTGINSQSSRGKEPGNLSVVVDEFIGRIQFTENGYHDVRKIMENFASYVGATRYSSFSLSLEERRSVFEAAYAAFAIVFV